MKGPKARGAEGPHINRLTPTHMAFSFVIYLLLVRLGLISFTIPLLVLLFCSELIDLDHLFSKLVYVKGRNPFKTRFLHRNWMVVFIISIVFIFIKPVFTLGLGLICHLFLDLIYVFIHKKLQHKL
jgi:hypothetical protein